MKREILVLDGELSPFGRHEPHGVVGCCLAVARRLLRRHPQLAQRIDLVAAGSAAAARTDRRENGLAQSLAIALGLEGAAGVDVREYCASANVALEVAVTAIEAGRAEVALVVGVDHLLHEAMRGPLRPESIGAEAGYGYSPPVLYALSADVYLRETGAEPRDLAAVAVRNRASAASNPNARYREPLTVEEVLASPVVAAPLTRLQCCPPADGSGALLVAAADALSGGRSPGAVRVRGIGAATNVRPLAPDFLSFREDVAAAARAYEEAGVGPEDVDVCELHDAFTICELIHLEDLGLAPRGEAWRGPRATLRVNPSGGLLSRGHPLGATGIAQVDSVRRALAGPQGSGRIGLVQEAGGIQVAGQMLSTCLIVEADS